ncbi:MAG: hypothetical protein LUG93_17285 [Lachnospiraceae bacterium]|nr:hypothetical protein [Lachnospiraceae bacterium]
MIYYWITFYLEDSDGRMVDDAIYLHVKIYEKGIDEKCITENDITPKGDYTGQSLVIADQSIVS